MTQKQNLLAIRQDAKSIIQLIDHYLKRLPFYLDEDNEEIRVRILRMQNRLKRG